METCEFSLLFFPPPPTETLRRLLALDPFFLSLTATREIIAADLSLRSSREDIKTRGREQVYHHVYLVPIYK